MVVGDGRVRIQRRIRHVQPGHIGRQAAAGARCQVRVHLPHDREVERLRFHVVREKMNLWKLTELLWIQNTGDVE